MTITVVVHVIILILLFYVGMKYLDPPLEEGIAINFGTTETGSGKIQPTEKIQSAPQKTAAVPPSQPKSEIKEEVVTQDNEDAPVIKKEKPKKQQTETPVKEQPKKEVKKPDPKPDKSTTDALSSILNGPKVMVLQKVVKVMITNQAIKEVPMATQMQMHIMALERDLMAMAIIYWAEEKRLIRKNLYKNATKLERW